MSLWSWLQRQLVAQGATETRTAEGSVKDPSRFYDWSVRSLDWEEPHEEEMP